MAKHIRDLFYFSIAIAAFNVGSINAQTPILINVAGDTNTASNGTFNTMSMPMSGDLRGALNFINQNAGNYDITFSLGASNTISLQEFLPILNLNAANTLSINGTNGAGPTIIIDGGSAVPGFFAEQGNITLQNFTLQNLASFGGKGGSGGGGGGMGAGGALFIDQATVVISNISMNTCSAHGGAGATGGMTNFAGGGGGGGFYACGKPISNGGQVGSTTAGGGGGGGAGIGGGGGNGFVDTTNFFGVGAGGGGIRGSGVNIGNGASVNASPTAGFNGGGFGAGNGGQGGSASGGINAGGGGAAGNTSASFSGGGGGSNGGSAIAPGSPGGAGGFGGGGGGGGSNQGPGIAPGFPGGKGGFGGGGGGGGNAANLNGSGLPNANGGDGGFGGGGGGAGSTNFSGGTGGFGGGGGGFPSGGAGFANGGVGGGMSGASGNSGGGGAGFGGGVFANSGFYNTGSAGSLTIEGPFSTDANNTTIAGPGGFSGFHAGNDAFFLTGTTITLDPNGSSITFTNSIADDSSSSFAGTPNTITKGTQSGAILSIGTENPSGTVNLIAANTYQGGTILNKGTVAISNNTSLGTGSLSFSTNNGNILQAAVSGLSAANPIVLNVDGTVDTNGNTMTLTGNITGNGSLTKQNTGTLKLSVTSGTNSYSGGTVISGGTLEIDSVASLPTGRNVDVSGVAAVLDLSTSGGPVTIGDLSSASGSTVAVGAQTLTFGTGNSTTFAGSFTGTGHLIKQNSGTFNLTGANAFTGVFDVNEGILHVASTGILASTATTNIAAGTTLSGTGTLGTVNLNGTLSPGDSIGTIHTGDFTFNTGSDYIVELSNSASDLVASSGTVTINGGTLVLAQFGVLSMPQSAYTIITSSVPIVKNGNFILNNPFPRFNFSIEYDPNDVMLVLLSINNFFATGNAGKAAECFNFFLTHPNSDVDAVIAILNMQTASQLQNSFNQMQPSNFNNFAFAQENVAERIRQNFSAHLFEQRVESCPSTQKWRIWVAPFLEHVHQRGEGGNKGYKETFRGFTAAADYQKKKHWTLTGGFSYADSDVGVVHGKAGADFKTYAGSLGTIWTGPHLIADVLFSYLFNSIDAKRRMRFSAPGVSAVSRTARSHLNSNEALGHLGLGIDFKWKAGEHGTVRFYPFADIDYVYIWQDGYKEHGAGSLNLKVKSKRYDLLRPEGGVGLGYAGCFKRVHVNADVTASYVREERYLGEKTKAKFEHVPCSFNVKGLKPDNNLFSPSARLTFASTGNAAFSFSLGYHGEFGEHFVENAGEAEFKVAF